MFYLAHVLNKSKFAERCISFNIDKADSRHNEPRKRNEKMVCYIEKGFVRTKL